MNLKKNNLLVFIGLFSAVIITACVKEKYDFAKVSVRNWSPNLAVPLVNSNLTINDILVNADKQGAIQIDPVTNFCTLVYKGKLFSEKASQFIQIPNQSFSPFTYNFGNTASVSSFNSAAIGSSFGPYVQNLSYTINTGYLIDSIYLKTGTTLNIVCNNSLPADVEITFTSSSIKDKTSGAPFTRTFTVGQYSNTVQSFDLGQQILNLNDGMGNRNIFKITYSAVLTKRGNAGGSESINLNLEMKNINFSAIIGFIGTLSNSIAPYQDTVPITLFKNSDALLGGTFNLVNPSVEAKFTNYFGCNVSLNFDKLDAYSPNNQNINTNNNTLTGTPITQNILINGATSFSTSGLTNILIDKNNTPSVVPFINSQPKNVIYKVNATTNPGATGYVRNFFTDSSRFTVDFNINMPLWGTASGFTLRDTQEVNVEGLDQFNNITFRTFFENQLPIEMDMSMIFVDSLYQPLVTLIPAGTVMVQGSNVNPATGELISSTITKKDYMLDRIGISKLKTAKKILIVGKANTSGGGFSNVKIYSTQKLNVRLGVQVQPNISVSTGK